MLALRPATADDFDAIRRLAVALNTVNLPADPQTLREQIATSERSFASPAERPGSERYLFVLEDDAHVIGCCQLIASHGTATDPHHSFQIDTEERYSQTLGRLFRHRLLRFRQSYTPHTELAGLILDAEHRGRSDRPGRLLVYGRLLYLAMEPSRFHPEIQAELLPPFEPDGSSLLWERIGRRFTGLSYAEADRLSRTNPEFLRALFPHDPIHIGLLPEPVQDVIGKTGPATAGVETLLRRAGFLPNGHVDPFDGGPHFAALRTEIPLLAAMRTFAPSPCDRGPELADAATWLVARRQPFRAIRTPAVAQGDALRLAPEALAALNAPGGPPERVHASPEPRRGDPS